MNQDADIPSTLPSGPLTDPPMATRAMTVLPPAPTFGLKADHGKDRWDLLPFDAVREVVKILMFGAVKYGDRNWENGISHSRLYAAAIRHLIADFEGQDLDEESGRFHLAHAACCVLFMLAQRLRGFDHFDDRPSL